MTGILEKYPLKLIDSPSLYNLLDSTFPIYPYDKCFQEAKHEPLVVLHTSGTTAVPRPIVYTHEFISRFAAWTGLHPPEGYQNQISLLKSNRLLLSLPFFHVSHCTYCQLQSSIHGVSRSCSLYIGRKSVRVINLRPLQRNYDCNTAI